MIHQVGNYIQLDSVNTEQFIKEVVRLTKEGFEYIPNTATMQFHGQGKSARFELLVEKGVEETPEVVLESPETTVEDVLEDNPSVSTTEEEKAPEDTSGQPEGSLPDWDYVKTLKIGDDAKKSRENLAEYAKGFGVKLKKNVSFEKMLKVFEESL